MKLTDRHKKVLADFSIIQAMGSVLSFAEVVAWGVQWPWYLVGKHSSLR